MPKLFTFLKDPERKNTKSAIQGGVVQNNILLIGKAKTMPQAVVAQLPKLFLKDILPQGITLVVQFQLPESPGLEKSKRRLFVKNKTC